MNQSTLLIILLLVLICKSKKHSPVESIKYSAIPMDRLDDSIGRLGSFRNILHFEQHILIKYLQKNHVS